MLTFLVGVVAGMLLRPRVSGILNRIIDAGILTK